MLLRAPILVVTALFAVEIMAKACNPGEYKDSNGDCQECADGYVSPDSPPSDGPYQCVPCPAGQSSNPQHINCVKCSPGNFNDVPGGICRQCAAGDFNNVSGAKACCTCCAGFYTDDPRTHCNSCPDSRPYSYVGSTSIDACVADQGNRPTPATDCKVSADNVCPNPNGGGPTGSPITRKKRAIHCTKGFESCPNYTGRGGYECVDTRNDPESCGGCVTVDGTGKGTDCTAMDGVSVSRCVKGSCVIDSCRKGYAVSSDGSSCAQITSADGSNPQAFDIQQVGATAKRVVLGRYF